MVNASEKHLTKRLTKLEQEKEDKKRHAEQDEILDTITQDSEEKAAKWIIELEKEKEKKLAEEKAEKLEELDKKRRFKKRGYVFQLALFAQDMFKQVDLPIGYRYFIGYGDDRLKITLTTPSKKTFGRGIKPIGVPRYDYHAVGVLIDQCENTIDKLEKRGNYSESGIILP